jgi:hypothetical protein
MLIHARQKSIGSFANENKHLADAVTRGQFNSSQIGRCGHCDFSCDLNLICGRTSSCPKFCDHAFSFRMRHTRSPIEPEFCQEPPAGASLATNGSNFRSVIQRRRAVPCNWGFAPLDRGRHLQTVALPQPNLSEKLPSFVVPSKAVKIQACGQKSPYEACDSPDIRVRAEAGYC